MNKPIQVFLRHCFYSPNSAIPNRTRPEWFDRERILVNFLYTIDNDITDYHFVYDEHFGTFANSFLGLSKQHLFNPCTDIHIINEGTEAGSFLKTLNLVKDLKFSPETIIYFLEDDYLHREGWCEALLEAFTLPVDYITLYDHFDKYRDYKDLKSEIFVTKSCHWRTTPSTTNTYAIKYGKLMDEFDEHYKFSINQPSGATADNSKFLYLADKGRKLISSIPGYSTHVQQGLMSPVVDWEELI